MSAMEALTDHAKDFTEATGIAVELVQEGNRIFVILRAVPLPAGVFRVASTDVLFIADTQYPVSALDMFWIEPDVVRHDGGVPQSAEAIQRYMERDWRRFSWHRNGRWTPTRNGLLDHFAFMEDRLAKETPR